MTTYPTFTPPQAPSVNGSSLTETGRVISNNFGDGYVQDAPDGLNTWPGKVQLSWSPIDYADATTIRNFFKSNVGKWFFYTLPRETTPRLWICTSVQRSWTYPAQDDIVATLEERFGL